MPARISPKYYAVGTYFGADRTVEVLLRYLYLRSQGEAAEGPTYWAACTGHCNVDDVTDLVTSLLTSHPLVGWGAGLRVFGSGALAPLVLGPLVGRTGELPLRFLGQPRVDVGCPPRR